MHQGPRHLGAQTRAADTASSKASGWRAHRLHESSADAEAGMLSGVSRKRSIRSNPCWFTEFCKSQCLSHFAAPFIVVRAETSVAESCEEAYKHLTINAKEQIQRHNVWSKTVTAGQERKKSKPNLPPPRPHERNKSQVRSHFRRFK